MEFCNEDTGVLVARHLGRVPRSLLYRCRVLSSVYNLGFRLGHPVAPSERVQKKLSRCLEIALEMPGSNEHEGSPAIRRMINGTDRHFFILSYLDCEGVLEVASACWAFGSLIR